ncbi:NAD-dependent epimerase/dehydratase family protein [Oscillatoria sp. CS-180]|uniref:NAD-dependent epimerase/dehydratase family protein n=1 Tax=Oscillatoria sp. CS-180 TaxID=3021720 RepID=UPI00232DA370|nr:NAD-dependent epimerase/dehydratase family protein [Oscillatoria sp. CS-180]MDB9527016.1 NAD-dependent epimerase/dehydratase family protein [Oscillatoria sp. CS-180]
MRILVIGGTGFIGHQLTAALVQQQHQVRVLSRKRPLRSLLHDCVNYIQGDFLDETLLRSSLEGIEIVYQMVSTTTPSTSNADPTYDAHSNVVGMVRLLELCVEMGVRKVIFPSSGGTIYGIPSRIPVAETHATDPICSYGITKLACEKYLHLFHYLHKLDYAILRVANPYGPGQNPTGKVGVIPRFLNRVLNNQPVTIWGDGSIVRDYVYITDVVDALCKVLKVTSEQKIFNIGAGAGFSLNELIQALQTVSGRDIKVIYQEGRPFDTPVNVLDINRARELLAWSPQVSLEEGLMQTWKWLYGTYETQKDAS